MRFYGSALLPHEILTVAALRRGSGLHSAIVDERPQAGTHSSLTTPPLPLTTLQCPLSTPSEGVTAAHCPRVRQPRYM